MRIVAEHGCGDPARVLVLELDDGSRIECAESVEPPVPREEKWVLIVSTLKGCPVRCPFCDAGGDYKGRLSACEILGQVELLVRTRYPDGRVPARRLKVQLARMGEPSFNPAVLEVLAALPGRVPAAGLMPCVSTIAPCGSEPFFERVLEIKQRLYPGRFQLQFSLHTTDEAQRGRLIPARCWSYPQIAAFGSRFHQRGERKVTLNFAAAAGLPLEPQQLGAVFDPAHFAVKLTPINPTHAATASGLSGQIDPASPATGEQCAAAFRAAGFETILSIGDVRENLIGSNCGMYVQRMQSGSRTQA